MLHSGVVGFTHEKHTCLYAGIAVNRYPHSLGCVCILTSGLHSSMELIGISSVGFPASTAAIHAGAHALVLPQKLFRIHVAGQVGTLKFVRRRCGHKCGRPDFMAQRLALVSRIPLR